MSSTDTTSTNTTNDPMYTYTYFCGQHRDWRSSKIPNDFLSKPHKNHVCAACGYMKATFYKRNDKF